MSTLSKTQSMIASTVTTYTAPDENLDPSLSGIDAYKRANTALDLALAAINKIEIEEKSTARSSGNGKESNAVSQELLDAKNAYTRARDNVHQVIVDNFPLDTEEQVRDVYGAWFCDLVGMDALMKMPVVSPRDLNLGYVSKYYQRRVEVAHLGDYPAVKFIDLALRPGIAIKVKGFDYNAYEDEGAYFKCVEVIYKRYGIQGDGRKGGFQEDNYVSGCTNKCDDGKDRESFFYHSGATHDFPALGRFLHADSNDFVKTSLMHRNSVVDVRFIVKTK